MVKSRIIKPIFDPIRVFYVGLISIIIVYLVVRFGLLWYINPSSRIPQDFNVYRLAAERLSEGKAIYVPTDELPYKYSPTFAYLFRYSFFFIEKKLAAAIWKALSVLAFLGALARFGHRLLQTARLERQVLMALIIGILLSWHGFLETLGIGQVDLLLGAGLIGLATSVLNPSFEISQWSWIMRSFLCASILAVKPHMALAIFPFCFGMGWAECLGVAVTTLIIYFLPSMWIGLDPLVGLFREWVACLRQQQDVTFMIGNPNQAIGAVIARCLGHPDSVGLLNRVFLGIDFSVFLALAWPNLRKATNSGLGRKAQLLWLAYGISSYLLFSPLSWRWFVFLWIPVVAIIAYVDEKPLKLLSIWAFLAILNHSGMARLSGMAEGDGVSFFGFYMWASLALFVAVLVLLRQRQSETSYLS